MERMEEHRVLKTHEPEGTRRREDTEKDVKRK
jgi:hypothetical protein